MRTAMIFMAVAATLSLMSAPLLAVTAQRPKSSLQRISVQVEGSGPDIILIPGLASSRNVWADLALKLRQSHRLHLVQIAGFAGAPAVLDEEGKVAAPAAEAVAEYIRTQRIEAPAIIGHSLGGEVALMLGARHPDQVGPLMVVDALPFYTLLMNPSATSETAASHAAAMRDSLLTASPEQAAAMQHAAIARLVKTEAVRKDLAAAGISSDRKTVSDAVYELMVTDLRPELSRIRVPVEVVYAYDDLYGVPASTVDAMYRQAYATTPDIHFTRVDGSFHFVMLDQPERFASIVMEFLDK
ncbi:alpha/beta fold hydrolase [Pseudomonas sp. NPDC090233]|uniref:alpha/beta fold hydrolase n=1 Tax=Pseudomonas sp. NPDC090233 TaxID=3364479 RepID=UPI00383ABF9F